MSSETDSSAALELSIYHEECVERAVQHLTNPVRLSSEVGSESLNSKLALIWGGEPVYIGSHRHATLSPFSRYITGDYLAYEVISRVQPSTSPYYDFASLVWESDRWGAGSLNFSLGNFEITVGHELGNIARWRSVDSDTVDTLDGIQDYSTWQERIEDIITRLKQNGISDDKIVEIIGKVESVREAYLDARSKSSTITGLCLEFERSLRQLWSDPHLSGEAYSNDDVNLEIVPSSSSEVVQKCIETLDAVNSAMTLEALYGMVYKEGRGSLFSGRNDQGAEMRIGYSSAKNRFELAYADPKTDKRIGKLVPISADEVIRLLYSGELTITGDSLTIALLLGSAHVPIVSHGNDYGKFAQTAGAMGMEQHDGVMSLTEDNRDAWPIVQIELEDGTVITPELVTLRLLFDESTLKDLFAQSIRTGKPVLVKENILF